MSNLNLIVLSYHVFGNTESDYPFSRTYKQFENDLKTKTFDWITIDDAHESIIDACIKMYVANIRAKIFVPTSLVGQNGYCSWKQLKHLSKHHDIECHSHQHKYLTELTDEEIEWNIHISCRKINEHIGRMPRYFVPPFNQYDNRVECIAKDFRLQLIKDRITIKNNTE